MPFFALLRRIPLRASLALLAGGVALTAAPLAGQSLTVGGLTATIVDERGAPVRDATVTLEHGGAPFRVLHANTQGLVTVAVLSPGTYTLLVEQLGYQPVRAMGVTVVAGGQTRVSVGLAHKPPPILAVEERPADETISGTTGGRIFSGTELTSFDRRHDISDLSRGMSQVQPAGDGRDGFAPSANGLLPSYTRFVVDGVEELLMRHPGLRGDPASAPLFARDGLQQAQYSGSALDGEWPVAQGGLLSATTRGGTGKSLFAPWASISSAKLGGATADNPGDSSSMSLQAGLAMGGRIKGDTGAWFLRGDYQQLEQPTAVPFEPSVTSNGGADLVAAAQAAALAHGGQNVNAWLAPTVRTWKGGSGMGRLDWHFGNMTQLAVRAGYASWKETNPLAGMDATNGAGSRLEATDASGAATFTTSGEDWTSETRLGFHASKRDWFGGTLPFTGLVGDGIALGTAATLPGLFKESGIQLSEAVTEISGKHTIKGGATMLRRKVTDDWLPGSAGEYDFGDVTSFNAGRGAFYQASRASAAPDISVTELTFFLQDTWQATKSLQLFGGAQYFMETLPSDAVSANVAWESVSGFANNIVPKAAKGNIGPRAGFTWNSSADGRTTIRGSAGLVPGRYDLHALSEAAQYDGDVLVRRATGTLAWPGVGAASNAAVVGPAITMFDAQVKRPRTFNGEVSVARAMHGGTTLTVSGAYRHSDYLLQRQDLNSTVAPLATSSDGRPIWGTLQQYGGLLTPAVGSNHRFSEIDMVYGLASTGYSDYYEGTLALERRMAHGFTLLASYTYSKATDDLPGAMSGDPADQLSPFPGGMGGVVWEKGRSDLDIPHRLAATIEYTTEGKTPWSLAARVRVRSGLPFTPGFRRGVDANGDGSGNNDPAFVGSSIAGMAALAAANSCLASQTDHFAGRNSCREDMVNALDLHASLPLRFAGHVTLVLDAFNVVGTTTGLVDHAAVLVNPAGTITTDASGHLVLPLIANTNFGSLLSRRGDPRMLRLGIRLEN